MKTNPKDQSPITLITALGESLPACRLQILKYAYKAGSKRQDDLMKAVWYAMTLDTELTKELTTLIQERINQNEVPSKL